MIGEYFVSKFFEGLQNKINSVNWLEMEDS